MAATIPLFWTSRTKALEYHLQRETLFLRDLGRQYKARPELDSVSLLSGRLYACTEAQFPLFQCLQAVACESCFRELLLPQKPAFATNARCRTSLHRKNATSVIGLTAASGAWTDEIQLSAPCAAPVSYDELIVGVQSGVCPPGPLHPRLNQ